MPGTKIGGSLIIEPDTVVEFRGIIGHDVISRGGMLHLDGKLSGSERYEVAESA